MSTTCKIIDSTLVDGEETPGVYFTHKQKLSIAHMLDESGVDYIMAGAPYAGETARRALKAIKQSSRTAEIVTFNRMKKEDIWFSVECGITSVHISVPSSSVLVRQLGSKPIEVLGELRKILDIAQKEGCRISVGAEDAPRANTRFLAELADTAAEYKAVRFRYEDTFGVLSPYMTRKAIKHLRSACRIPIEFHAKNDFGMATANTIEAFNGGAETVSCSLLGLGSRAGNADTEGVVACLRFLFLASTNADFGKLRMLCRKIARIARIPMPQNKPLIGRNVFTSVRGAREIGSDGPISYEALGRRKKTVPGIFSNVAEIQHIAYSMGITLSEDRATEIVSQFHKQLAFYPGLKCEKVFSDLLYEESTHNDKTSVDSRL
jgi:homocitrate synthase NifV